MMNLQGILSISGKPGLYKIIGQSRGGVLVNKIGEKRKISVPGNARMSALEDIAIYTYDEEIPLKKVMFNIFNQEEGKATINHKISEEELKDFFRAILDEYDEERVYASDIRKIIQWYNILQSNDLLIVAEEVKEEKEENTENA